MNRMDAALSADGPPSTIKNLYHNRDAVKTLAVVEQEVTDATTASDVCDRHSTRLRFPESTSSFSHFWANYCSIRHHGAP